MKNMFLLNNYFKIAWRNLLRNKVYSSINILGLSLGLACCMLIILYSKDEVSYDRFHDNAQNIYRITNTRFGADGKVEEKEKENLSLRNDRKTKKRRNASKCNH